MHLSPSHHTGLPDWVFIKIIAINQFIHSEFPQESEEGRKEHECQSPKNKLLRIYVGGTSQGKRRDSIFYRLSTRLSAPRMRPRSSLILGGGGCSSSLPSIARRRCVFCASRSSSRCEQMRNIRDETVSAEARYNSMSCTPAAKASRVGASPEVMRDN